MSSCLYQYQLEQIDIDQTPIDIDVSMYTGSDMYRYWLVLIWSIPIDSGYVYYVFVSI